MKTWQLVRAPGKWWEDHPDTVVYTVGRHHAILGANGFWVTRDGQKEMVGGRYSSKQSACARARELDAAVVLNLAELGLAIALTGAAQEARDETNRYRDIAAGMEKRAQPA